MREDLSKVVSATQKIFHADLHIMLNYGII